MRRNEVFVKVLVRLLIFSLFAALIITQVKEIPERIALLMAILIGYLVPAILYIWYQIARKKESPRKYLIGAFIWIFIISGIALILWLMGYLPYPPF